MSKFVSELNEARANSAITSSTPHRQHRQRLAERLVTLAPLARAPLVAETERGEPDDGLSRLSLAARSRVFEPKALVPLEPSALPRAGEPARLSLVGISPPQLDLLEEELRAEMRRRLMGFLIGLATAAAIGIGLYAALT